MSLPKTGFVRLSSIIGPNGVIPVSRSTWWAGIKAGRFPRPFHIGRAAVWQVEDIRKLMQQITQSGCPSVPPVDVHK